MMDLICTFAAEPHAVRVKTARLDPTVFATALEIIDADTGLIRKSRLGEVGQVAILDAYADVKYMDEAELAGLLRDHPVLDERIADARAAVDRNAVALAQELGEWKGRAIDQFVARLNVSTAEAAFEVERLWDDIHAEYGKPFHKPSLPRTDKEEIGHKAEAPAAGSAKPQWMAKLDQVEEALAAALASLPADKAFLMGMRWSSFRYALLANNKEEAAMRLVQICKRLDDAGIESGPWALTLASCAYATN